MVWWLLKVRVRACDVGVSILAGSRERIAELEHETVEGWAREWMNEAC